MDPDCVSTPRKAVAVVDRRRLARGREGRNGPAHALDPGKTRSGYLQPDLVDEQMRQKRRHGRRQVGREGGQGEIDQGFGKIMCLVHGGLLLRSA